KPYPDCGCYCPNECGPFETRNPSDCGCHCSTTCHPPYVQTVDCQCVPPDDPCNGVVCNRGPQDHCENGTCVCNPNRTCGDICSGQYGIRIADDGCGTYLTCNCGCQPGCDFCLPQDGSCPDQGCGPGLPPPNPCCSGQTLDCAGVCNGNAQPDCAGVCNGNAQRDCAGVCNGGNQFGCGGGRAGGGMVNGCGVRGGEGGWCGCQWYDCFGVCNGGAQVDCAGVCGGGRTIDNCGVCGGDGSSCACQWYDCAGVC